MREVGEVMQFYDVDKRFPPWGFGGRTANGTVSHCFNLNGSASDVEVGRFLLFKVFWKSMRSMDMKPLIFHAASQPSTS
ncbi:protein BONZAI 3 [Prunus yedoensis var. nudiflora]|uniref:Protein BONZAI 3 n=1 Tax=Prunus yedoensis var. nudiflora TaxID=2094558 RepID=A0A314XXL8_PRUYE|nr:protein BONZAI 3 [Prunus yedoensis var. nudiflora]